MSAEPSAAPREQEIADPLFRRAVELLDAGAAGDLKRLLDAHPRLVTDRVNLGTGDYFACPSLLEFVAENPVRNGRLPGNIAEVTQVILDAGAEPSARQGALLLVATGKVSRECGVQQQLLALLCQYGADPAGAARAAAAHGELDAVQMLIRLGAEVDLPVAVAVGLEAECRQLLEVSSAEQRHLAMALAAQYGRTAILQTLLDAGEDPDRFNPAGAHSHATPLHQAALAGHTAVVRLLVGRGARLDQKDLRWRGTPLDWALHAGRSEVAAFLQAEQIRRGATGLFGAQS